MKTEENPPLLLLAFRRPEHLAKTLEALSLQKNLQDFEIYFFVDGLPPQSCEKHQENHRRVIALVEEFSGGRKVHREIGTQNRGVWKSFHHASRVVLERHESLIYLEEDIVPFDDEYLNFMKKALERYQSDSSVFAVNGFCFGEVASLSPPEGFFSYRFCPWGFGTWKNRLESVSWDLSEIRFRKFSPLFWWHFQRDSWGWGWTLFAYTFLPFLRSKIQPWDILFCLHHYLHGHVSYFPKSSLVYNGGLDGSGLHASVPLVQPSIDPKETRGGDNICFPSKIGVDLNNHSRMAKRISRIFRNKALRSGGAWLKKKGAFWKRENIL